MAMAMAMAPALAAMPARRVGHMYEDDSWRWVWGSVLMLALIAVLVAAVWVLARSSSLGRRDSDPGGSSATEMLAQRYARGEIDTEEYQERLAVLTAWPSAPRGGKTRGRDRPDSPSS
ncbi:SHOCT domain-containing protein [Embleya sp. NPDC005575]|uniref:SHOCT domain-containing protein n=1 Tax=Embleya sp. NPDC005575 TaxID=3156892 RepID=UPI0033BA9034